jgi:hypothetical protein
MSGVFSIASHCALQYLPEAGTHEQTGCAHFLAGSLVISLLLVSDQNRAIRDGMIGRPQNPLLYKKEHF